MGEEKQQQGGWFDSAVSVGSSLWNYASEAMNR